MRYGAVQCCATPPLGTVRPGRPSHCGCRGAARPGRARYGCVVRHGAARARYGATAGACGGVWRRPRVVRYGARPVAVRQRSAPAATAAAPGCAPCSWLGLDRPRHNRLWLPSPLCLLSRLLARPSLFLRSSEVHVPFSSFPTGLEIGAPGQSLWAVLGPGRPLPALLPSLPVRCTGQAARSIVRGRAPVRLARRQVLERPPGCRARARVRFSGFRPAVVAFAAGSALAPSERPRAPLANRVGVLRPLCHCVHACPASGSPCC